jgi:hypothetical protein
VQFLEIVVRHLGVCLTALLIIACSGGEKESSENMVRNSAGETKAERDQGFRDKLKTDSEAAEAEAIKNIPRNERLANTIEAAGYLCERVVSAEAAGGNINVECVEYRNGLGRARYSIDPDGSRVEPR